MAGKGKYVEVGAGEVLKLGGLTQVIKLSMRMITQFTPGGLEGMTREFHELFASGEPDPDKMAEVSARYDTEFFEPFG